MKPAELLLAALSGVRSEWVEEAAPAELLPGDDPLPKVPHRKPKTAPGRAVWLRWGAMAACAVLICLAGWQLTRPGLGSFSVGQSADSSSAVESAAAADAAAPAAESAAPAEPAPEAAGPAPEAAPEAAEDSQSTEKAEEGSLTTNGAEAAAPDLDRLAADGAALAAAVGTATDLPLLSLGEPASGGMGYEGYMAYSLDELSNGNPWLAASEAERAALTRLPVYRTKNANRYGIPLSLTEAEQRAMAEEAAAALGVTITAVEPKTVEPGNQGTTLPGDAVWRIAAATSGGYTIEVEGNGLVTVWGKEGVYHDIDAALPARYSFTYADTTPDQAAQTLNYLLKEYAAFTGLQSPAHAIFADRNIYGERSMSYSAYEGSGTLAEQIISYGLRQVRFAPNDAGKLMLIRKNDATAAAEPLGDYPLLTADEAAALLANGNYLTTVPYELTDADTPVRVELLYRTDEMLMPYYRFLVELPDSFAPKDKPGLHDYGAYYVPAVRPEYLTELPVWDGQFN